jgi:outer membrane protein TolC
MFAPSLRAAVAALAVVLAAAPVARAEPPAPEVAPAGWTLERALARALDHSEAIAAATARQRASAARLARGRAELFGEVTVAASATRRAREVTREVGGESVTLQSRHALAAQVVGSLPLLDLRARLGLRELRLAEDAAALDLAETRRRLALVVTAQYLAVLGAEQVVAAAERRAEYARARLADARARADAGLTSKSDATGAELELATAEREQVSADADLGVARAELGYQVAAEIDGPLEVPSALLAAATGSAAPAGRRLDLEAAERRVAAAEAAAAVPDAGFWPTLDLAGLVRVHNEPGFTGQTHDWSIALVATWPVWDGGRRRAETREREAVARAAAAELAADRRAQQTEITVAHTRLEGARRALVAAERAAEAAARYADEVAILYAQGLTRALEVTDAGARRFDAEVALARARLAVGVAFLEELGAAGGEVVTR